MEGTTQEDEVEVGDRRDFGFCVDPLLGVNLEGDLRLASRLDGDSLKMQRQSGMDYDSKYCVIKGRRWEEDTRKG